MSNAIAPLTEVRSIKGHVRLSLPRAGKIRLGIRTEKGYPKEVDYFVLDQDLPGRAKIIQLYGEKPKRILVTLVSSDAEEVFPHALKAYGKGLGLLCRGNGEKALRARVAKGTDGRDVIQRDNSGRPLTEERSCPCDWLKSKKCRALGNLTIVLPEVGLGVYQIDTSSWWSMQNVRSDLAFLNSMFAPRGGVRGMLLWLERVPKTTHGSGREETHYPLRLTLPTPQEYAARAKGVEGLIASYQSVLGATPALDAGPSPASLPHGSPPEEDLHTEADLVDPAEAGAAAPDVGDGGGDGEIDDAGDVDPDEDVGMPPDTDQPEDAEAPIADEQRVALRERWEALEEAVARSVPAAPGQSRKAAAAAYLLKELRLDFGEFGRNLTAGKVSSARASEVIGVLDRALARLEKPKTQPPAKPVTAPTTASKPQAGTSVERGGAATTTPPGSTPGKAPADGGPDMHAMPEKKFDDEIPF